jgi:hypothetical protein
MTAAVQAVLEQAKRLTAEERAELFDELMALEQDPRSLDADAFAKAWRPELDRRWARFERGETQAVDAREVIQVMRERLRSGT